MGDEQVFAGHSIVIVRRAGNLFVQYDGGALVPKWLEAPVSEVEAEFLTADEQSAYKMLLQLEARSKPAPMGQWSARPRRLQWSASEESNASRVLRYRPRMTTEGGPLPSQLSEDWLTVEHARKSDAFLYVLSVG